MATYVITTPRGDDRFLFVDEEDGEVHGGDGLDLLDHLDVIAGLDGLRPLTLGMVRASLPGWRIRRRRDMVFRVCYGTDWPDRRRTPTGLLLQADDPYVPPTDAWVDDPRDTWMLNAWEAPDDSLACMRIAMRLGDGQAEGHLRPEPGIRPRVRPTVRRRPG